MATVRAFRATVICILLVGSSAFDMRKRSIPRWSEGNIDEAMGYDRLQDGRMDPGPNYYWGEDQPDPNQLLIAELLAREADQEGRGGYYSPDDAGLNTHETPVGMEELEELLSDDEAQKVGDATPVKRRIPFQLGGPRGDKREYDPSSMVPEKKEALSDKQVEDLFSDTDGKDGEEVERLREYEQVNGDEVPVTEEELKEALGNDGEEVHEVEGEIASEPEENKEVLGAPVIPSDIMAQKKKRSGREMGQISFDHEPDQAEIARAYIKKFLELEDDENANLANALNYATLSQVQKSDKYVKPEADYIKKAIEDEEQIQELKSNLKTSVSIDEDEDPRMVAGAEEEVVESPPLLRKRMYPEEMANEFDEEEAEEQVPEEEFAEEIPDEGDDELTEAKLRAFLSAKLRQFLLRTPTYGENQLSSVPEDMGEWYDRPVDEREEGVSVKDLYLNPFLRKIIEKYRADMLTKRGEPPDMGVYDEDEVPVSDFEQEEEEEEGDFPGDGMEEELGESLDEYVSHLEPWQKEVAAEVDAELEREQEALCPSLDLVNDCEIARQLGLKLDQEAMDLCNRHQLCYTCGAAHGLEAFNCDVEYRDDASRLCLYESSPSKCRQDAVAFLTLLQEKHPFLDAYDAPQECLAACTKDWIYGL